MSTYTQLTEKFHKAMGADPIELVEKEDFSRADELPDLSKRAIEDEASAYLSLAEEIEATDVTGLPLHQQIDLEMAAHTLRASVLEQMALIGDSPRHTVRPIALKHILGQTPLYLERDTRDKAAILDGFVARMGNIGPYLRGQLDKLDRPVDFMTTHEIDTGDGFDEVAAGVMAFADAVGYGNKANLERALESASVHIAEYVAELRGMETRAEYSLGNETAAKWFMHKGITLSPDEIHGIAQEYLQRGMDTLDAMKATLIARYDLPATASVQQVAETLKGKYASPKGNVVGFAQKIQSDAEQFAYKTGLVSPLKDAVVDVRSCPTYLQATIPIAAMVPPGSFAQGEKKSTFYINEFDGIERGLNRLNLPGIAAHELIPGHAYQLTRATENPSLVRAWVSPMDTAEGWTTYVAEEVMAETGFFGDPELQMEEQFMQQVDFLRLGGRVCFVLAGLTGDRRYLENSIGVEVRSPDLLTAATELYSGITGFSPERAGGDVRLFSSIGTYGALYLVGNHYFHQMEGKARAKQGSDFHLPNLLEGILKEGNLPLAYIGRQLEHNGVL